MEVASSAVALTSLEYLLEPKQMDSRARYVQERIWDRPLTNLRKEVKRFYQECLTEIEPLPKRFEKDEVIEFLMTLTSATIHYDKELRKVLIRIAKSYPQHPLNSKKANDFVRALRALSRLYATRGIKHNRIYLTKALESNLPYLIFSDLVLGTYTASYFHEYRARATDQHFRHHLLLIRSRSRLLSRKTAIDGYFEMLKPTTDAFREFSKSKCKLWLLMGLWNSKDLKEFAREKYVLTSDKTSTKSLARLREEYSKNQDKLRLLLYRQDPEVFRPIHPKDKATVSLWNDTLLLRLSR